jgi:photosystem II stability/assembly factor-like uncharacterized protein
LSSSFSVFGQWFPVNSGTTSNLNGAYLLDSGVGFAVGDTGTILKSTDFGATWVPLSPGTTRALYDVYFFDPDQGVAVGERGLILRTTDAGTGWQTVASGVRDVLRSISFSGVNGICGGDSQDILYSTDAGASWQLAQGHFFGGGFLGAQMLSSTTGFVAGQNSIFQPLVGNTTDGGVHWTFHNFYFDGNEGGCNDVFFLDQNTGLVSGSVFDGRGAIARTTDSALNWSTAFYDQAIESVTFPTTGSGFAVGYGGRILHTTDTGNTWDDQTSGSSANLHDVSFASDALTGIVVGDSGVVLRTTDGGEPSPTPTPTPGQIVLQARTLRLPPNCKLVKLRWTGANSRQVDIYRNGSRLARVPNHGGFKDTLCTNGQQYTYQVCTAGTQNCSNEVTIRGPR